MEFFVSYITFFFILRFSTKVRVYIDAICLVKCTCQIVPFLHESSEHEKKTKKDENHE